MSATEVTQVTERSFITEAVYVVITRIVLFVSMTYLIIGVGNDPNYPAGLARFVVAMFAGFVGAPLISICFATVLALVLATLEALIIPKTTPYWWNGIKARSDELCGTFMRIFDNLFFTKKC